MTIGEMIALAAFAGGGAISTGKILGAITAMKEQHTKDMAEVKSDVKALANDVRDVMVAQAEQRGAAASHVNVIDIAPGLVAHLKKSGKSGG